MNAGLENGAMGLSRPGKRCAILPRPDVPETALPESLARQDLELPELDEDGLERHYARLACLNAPDMAEGLPQDFAPARRGLAAHAAAALFPGFAHSHALLPESLCQGSLELVRRLQSALSEISGFLACCLQPMAGPQSWLAGLLMMRERRRERGEPGNGLLLVSGDLVNSLRDLGPLAGYRVRPLLEDPEAGLGGAAALLSALGDGGCDAMASFPDPAGRRLGGFAQACERIHASGGYVFAEGSRMGALAGIARPGELGIDLMCVDLQRAFSAYRSAGGAGALLCAEGFSAYLPGKIAVQAQSGECRWATPGKSVPCPRPFFGEFAELASVYAAIRMLGAPGLRRAAETAALNANYLKSLVAPGYPEAAGESRVQAFTLRFGDGRALSAKAALARLMDRGLYPPSILPSRADGDSLIVEPGESVGADALEEQAAALLSIAGQGEADGGADGPGERGPGA